MSTPSSTLEVTSWLDKLDDKYEAVVASLRHLVLGVAPETHEVGHHNAVGYSTSSSSFDRILCVSVSSDHISLGFFFGSSLHDPEHLLRGAGMRMRHIKITRADDLWNPDVHKLIRQALEDGPEHAKRLHERQQTP